MARSHHRKKHKQHLQQFKHRSDTGTGKAASKGSSVFAVGGAVFGFAISYMAFSGNIAGMIGGVLVGGAIGYFLGKKIDTSKKEEM
jgi:membrane associated rhomboid family serine protease